MNNKSCSLCALVKSIIAKMPNSKGKYNTESPISMAKSKARPHQTNEKQLLYSRLGTEISLLNLVLYLSKPLTLFYSRI